MSNDCQKITFNKRIICAGDLKHKITLQSRNQTAPHGVDYSHEFTDIASVWSAIKTRNGEEMFNEVNVSEPITHVFYIRFRGDVTEQVYVLYKNERYNIKNVININESNEFLQLNCNIKGSENKAGSNW